MNKVKEEIEELLYQNAQDFKIAKVLKKEIKTYFDTLEESFATSGGKDFLVKHTKKIDSLLKIIFKVAQREMFGDYAPMKNSIPIAMVALGSYGREQLCVHSDIDLMIVYKDVKGYNVKEMIEKILYILWDTGLKLGHRVHTIDDLFAVAKTDITIKTALLESRFIEGSSFIWTETQNSITQIRHENIEEFIRLKEQEQKSKHNKYHLTMEPNLKEGVGGFRDANLVYWIGKILYNANNIKNLPTEIIKEQEYRPFRIALEFLFRVRSALHLVSGKKEDRLRLDLIPSIANLLGYEAGQNGQMKCAKKVTESLKIIRLYTVIWLERLTKPYHTQENKTNTLYPPKVSHNFHTLLKTLCKHANKPFYPHPTYLSALIDANRPERPDDEIYHTLYTLFERPYSYIVLRTLSDARLLKYAIPTIKQVVDLPQFDGYHQYAVDIHSIHCVYHLEHIQEPRILALYEALSPKERVMLKIVTFLHDAGKGRKTDHHFVSASLFKVFAQKVNMDAHLMEMAETLINYHTLMSKVAQREDLYCERTIVKFASHFKSKKLLDMIYILSYADMSGVGGDIYNSFSAQLLYTLYTQSLEVLGETQRLNELAKRVKKEQSIQRDSSFQSLTKVQQKKILQIPSNHLFLRYSAKKIITIATKGFETTDYVFEIDHQTHLSIEIFSGATLHLSQLLERCSNLDVVNMEMYKLFDTIKYIKIDFAQHIESDELPMIKDIIHGAFKKQAKSSTKPPHIKAKEIRIDCEHSKTHAVMYLNAQNQKGLLAFVIAIFNEMGIDIITAKIHTLKYRAKDMFLIERNGNFCHNMDVIIEKLTQG